jgi:alginate O-acetyltransferase complex protein AlgI
MLFNSAEFLFLFLPIVLFLFHFAQTRISLAVAIRVLVAASIFFYGWWQPIYLILLISSILVNFYLAKLIFLYRNKPLTVLAVSLNLASIIYYKYANFFVDNLELVVQQNWHFEQVLLPLAISFFTFQQIAYVVDVYRKGEIEHNFMNYMLFVTFFPQLIAGPIVHHGSMMPQFADPNRLGLTYRNVVVGLSIFAIGLFKKTVLADGAAVYANPIFMAADTGSVTPDFFLAWGGALAYTVQLYFDFSGYSDMALGLGLLFGISLPLNFNSPYKSLSISDFWRRWHMTLSQFLRDYLYIALGGNRFGKFRRYINLFLTMLLGGLWHGAGWNFLIWGVLHGCYLVVNHSFTALKPHLHLGIPKWFATTLSWLITFIAIVVGWVFFRATTLDGAFSILAGMAGLNGFSLPSGIIIHLKFAAPVLEWLGVTPSTGGGAVLISTWAWSIALILLAVIAPNVHDLFYAYLADESRAGKMDPVSRWQWRPTVAWAVFLAFLLVMGLSTLGQVSEFLYFNF